ncbi:hypothetical protein RHMOL_Rhmol01G0025900 [Rhododendron molle]|uniref:Uncharacterized protein n=1 Tax=Rhododendron molle TaxID=49168 RepID=A0ACC0PZY2_RHOML|nr:hypothetical protein RHMOL_Rhmol01G0025900 [Rhododendron molle]
MEVEKSAIVKNDEATSNIKREEEDSDRKTFDSDRKTFEAYAEQVHKTEGYEVTISRPGKIMRGFLPMDISVEKRYQDYDMCAQLAVDKFNSLFKEQVGLELEFVTVLMVAVRPSCVFTFYITFEAKDLADEAKVKTYQTQVLMGLPRGTWKVKTMRPKPNLDEQGKINPLALNFASLTMCFVRILEICRLAKGLNVVENSAIPPA